ncbi:MAG TPA: hypothetical protein VGW37_05890 [Terriglobia bacterium]|nr:hypothetical protein [Terriglobia bacterium]
MSKPFLAVLFGLVPGLAPAQSPAVADPTPKPVAITVGSQPCQTFGGLGAGAWGSEDYARLSPPRRVQLNDLVWRQARFNTLRIWFRLKEYAPAPGQRRFEQAFPDSEASQIRDALAAGVRHLVLGPAALPGYLLERLPAKGHDGNGQAVEPYLKPDQAQEHAAIIADFIAELERKHHLSLEATGLQNEPNDPHDCVFTPEDVVRGVKLLRAALDARGLQRVLIIAPESVGCNPPADAQLLALEADAAAWHALGGIASHDYDGGATHIWADAIAATPKAYWMTEFCVGGPEETGDFFRGAAEAAAFLSDLNHRVSYWCHFIAYLSEDPHDNGTRLVAYSNSAGAETNWCKIFEPYYYLSDLGHTFDPGAVFRQSISSLENEMTWVSKNRPRVIVAAARNPDGSWGVGVCDYTAKEFPHGFWYRGKPAQSFEVTLKIQELAKTGAVAFQMCRRGPQTPACTREPMTMQDGSLTLTINPLELLTLRSGAQ